MEIHVLSESSRHMFIGLDATAGHRHTDRNVQTDIGLHVLTTNFVGLNDLQNEYFQRKLEIDILTIIILSLYYGRLYSFINYQPDLPDDTKYFNVGTLMNMIDRVGEWGEVSWKGQGKYNKKGLY